MKIPGTYRNGWALVANPGYTGKPWHMVAVCHDRSPFTSVVCNCGNQMHLHETQIVGVPDDAETRAATTAASRWCSRPATSRKRLQQMRDDGWIE